jgi:hypothetical protein
MVPGCAEIEAMTLSSCPLVSSPKSRRLTLVAMTFVGGPRCSNGGSPGGRVIRDGTNIWPNLAVQGPIIDVPNFLVDLVADAF